MDNFDLNGFIRDFKAGKNPYGGTPQSLTESTTPEPTKETSKETYVNEFLSEVEAKLKESRGEMLDEGMLDKIKDRMVSMGKKLLSKFSPEDQASMKAAAEKVLGPNYSKEDITLDKAKEIGKIISGGLDESQQLDENLRKKIGGVLVGLGLPTAFVAGHGFGGTDVGAITAGIGIAAAMLGYAMTAIDEGQEVEGDIKDMVKEEEEDKEEVEVSDEVEVEGEEDMDMDMDMEEEGGVDDLENHLESALKIARSMGDEKLADQIGNTVTFFTRQYVAREQD